MGVVTSFPGFFYFLSHFQHASLAKWSSAGTGLAMQTSSFPSRQVWLTSKVADRCLTCQSGTVRIWTGETHRAVVPAGSKGAPSRKFLEFSALTEGLHISLLESQKNLTQVKARPKSWTQVLTHRFIDREWNHTDLGIFFFFYLKHWLMSLFSVAITEYMRLDDL